MKIIVEDNKYILVEIDPLFWRKYGTKQYAFYEWVADNENEEHLATIYIPDGYDWPILAGTLAHEVSRFMDDYLQTKRATMSGEIVQKIMEGYYAK